MSLVPKLYPTITVVQPRLFSPNADGEADTAQVTVTVNAPHRLYWGLTQGHMTVTRGVEVRDVSGPYTFTVDGLDSDGRPLPDGTYDLELSPRSPTRRSPASPGPRSPSTTHRQV